MPAEGKTRLKVLGPFIGHVTPTTAKIWFHLMEPPADNAVQLDVRLEASSGPKTSSVLLRKEDWYTGIAFLTSLKADERYAYSVTEASGKYELDFGGLEPGEFQFRTLKEGTPERLDFLLLSCHNPFLAEDDGCGGFAVWSTLSSIIKENDHLRFAIMGGDQIYADQLDESGKKPSDLARNTTDANKRIELYLSVYRRFWDNKDYRKVLCKLPAVMIWDDHDINDGWGSDKESFNDQNEFKADYLKMFEAARDTFRLMQASRNPDALFANGPRATFDFCFKAGNVAFLVPDLRSNRNVRKERIWTAEQFEAMKQWVERERHDLEAVFFVSPVVFSHGDPNIDEKTVESWPFVQSLVGLFEKSKVEIIKGAHSWFNENLGDITDDINDSWGSAVNAAEADRILDYLFSLQNPSDGKQPIHVVILSGDIHTPGYSTIYSAQHDSATIPHIVASPVSYKPFSWMLEAVYRHKTKTVSVGKKGCYTSQVSHHYCARNAVVLSLRKVTEKDAPTEEDLKNANLQLKVKYYLEGYPEPQIMLFDLRHSSSKENVQWPEQSRASKQPLPA